MDFDGAVSKERARARISIRPPKGEPKLFSYKLYFDCTNNVAEYEALVLGLKVLKNLKAKNIYIYGDSELIISQVKGIYQAKHPRLRLYRNLVLDSLESFKEYHLSFIRRNKNVIVDALEVSASVFKIHIYPNKKYEIEIKHRPAILNNVDHWQVLMMTSNSTDSWKYLKSLRMYVLIKRTCLKNKMQSQSLSPLYI